MRGVRISKTERRGALRASFLICLLLLSLAMPDTAGASHDEASPATPEDLLHAFDAFDKAFDKWDEQRLPPWARNPDAAIEDQGGLALAPPPPPDLPREAMTTFLADLQRLGTDQRSRGSILCELGERSMEYTILTISIRDQEMEHAATSAYVGLLDAPAKATRCEAFMFATALRHLAAAGDRHSFERVALAASRRVGGWIATSRPIRRDDLWTAISLFMTSARIAWRMNWRDVANEMEIQTVRLASVTRAPERLLIQAELAESRLEADRAASPTVAINSLIARLRNAPAAAFAGSAGAPISTDLPLPYIETKLRVIASLAVARGEAKAAGSLIARIAALPWVLPPEARASSIALRLAKERALAACAPGSFPAVHDGGRVAAGNGADKTVSLLISAAGHRAEALGLLRRGHFRDAGAALDQALLDLQMTGFKSGETDVPPSRLLRILSDTSQVLGQVASRDELLALRVRAAAFAGEDAQALAAAAKWLARPGGPKAIDEAVYATVQLFGALGRIEPARRILEMTHLPAPPLNPEFTFLSAELSLRKGDPGRSLDELSKNAFPDGTMSFGLSGIASHRVLRDMQLRGRLLRHLGEDMGAASYGADFASLLGGGLLRDSPDYRTPGGMLTLLSNLADRLAAHQPNRPIDRRLQDLMFVAMQLRVADPVATKMQMNVAALDQPADIAASRLPYDPGLLYSLRAISDQLDFIESRIARASATSGAPVWSPIGSGTNLQNDRGNALLLLESPCPEQESAVNESTIGLPLSGFELARMSATEDRPQAELSQLLQATRWPEQQIQDRASVAAQLHPDEAVVIATEAGDHVAIATVLPRNPIIDIRLADRQIAEDDMRALRTAVTRAPGSAAVSFPSDAALRSFSTLFGDLPGVKDLHVFVILDTPLQRLPLNALLAAWDASLPMGRQAWTDTRMTLVSLPSLSLLGEHRRDADSGPVSNPADFMGIGAPSLLGPDPQFGPAEKVGLSDERRASSPSSSATPVSTGYSDVAGHVAHLNPLPQAHDLLLQLSPPGTTLLVGDKATLRRMRRPSTLRRLGDARVVEFATHALTAKEAADLSGRAEPALVLTPDAKRGDNGLLWASDIAKMRLSADVVMLIACASGSRDTETSVSYAGLVDPFLTAGAQSLVVSGWPVDEDATAKLFLKMSDADDHWWAAPADSLKIAMQDVRKAAAYEHPYYWAAFSVLGAH